MDRTRWDSYTAGTGGIRLADDIQPADLQAELDSLRAENEQLRTELAALPNSEQRGWRGWLSVVLVILFAVSLAPTNTATWFMTTVFDEDTFVDTLAPLPRDPAVSAALGITLAEALVDQEEATAAVAETLPPNLEFMAAPLASALQDLAVGLSQDAIASDAFASTWQIALRTSHQAVIALLGGARDGLLVAEDGAIVLDLSGLANNISAQLSEVGIDFVEIEEDGAIGKIALYESESLATAQSGAKTVYTLRWFLPVFTILLAGAAIWVGRDRRRVIGWLGGAAALSMLVTLIIVRVARQATVGSIEDETAHAGADAAWQILLNRYVAQTWSVLTIGAIVALVAWFFGSSERAMRWRDDLAAWQQARRDGTSAPAGVAAFATRYRRPLQWGAVVLAALVLMTVSTVTVWVVVFTLLPLLAWVTAVEILGGNTAAEPAPEPAIAD